MNRLLALVIVASLVWAMYNWGQSKESGQRLLGIRCKTMCLEHDGVYRLLRDRDTASCFCQDGTQERVEI